MYGICAITGKTKNKSKTINRMTKALSYRNSISDTFEDDKVALGLASFSKESCKPVYNESKNLVLVYSGNIYNSHELSQELTEAGHVFATKDSGEVLLHGFEEWGEDMFSHLRGAFAFAIYNKEDASVFLARDFFGIKPLYYTLIGKELVFASEIKSILRHPDFEKNLNANALNNYLSFQYPVAEETFFEGVYCLLPGYFMWYKNSDIMTERYFEPKFTPDESLSEQDAINMIETAVSNSVNICKDTDEEAGCLLSNGINSQYITSYFTDKKTFSISFEEAEAEEDTNFAEPPAQKADTAHFSKSIDSISFWDAVPEVVRLTDQPLADPWCIPFYIKTSLASEHIKVAFSSEGADELFGGYGVYQSPMKQQLYHKLVPYSFRKALRNLARKMPDNKTRSYLIRSCDPLEEAYIGKNFMCNLEEKRELLKDASLATRPQNVTRPYYRRARKFDDVAKMQYADINLYLTGNELLKAERMCTANGLELRLPYLDKEVWRAACRIPQNLRVNKKGTKYAFRHAAANHISQDETTLRPHLPLGEWIKSEKYYNIIKEEFKSPTAQKFFNIDVLLSWLDDHYEALADNTRNIWTVYIFLVWYKEYFEEVTATEIKEDAIAEIKSISADESVEVAQSTIGIPDQERLDELFGMAFDDEDGAGIDENLLADTEEISANKTED